MRLQLFGKLMPNAHNDCWMCCWYSLNSEELLTEKCISKQCVVEEMNCKLLMRHCQVMDEGLAFFNESSLEYPRQGGVDIKKYIRQSRITCIYMYNKASTYIWYSGIGQIKVSDRLFIFYVTTYVELSNENSWENCVFQYTIWKHCKSKYVRVRNKDNNIWFLTILHLL